jgi:hypothetical protein
LLDVIEIRRVEMGLPEERTVIATLRVASANVIV